MTQFSSLWAAYLDEELGTDDQSILFTVARRKSAINKGAAKFAQLTECLTRSTTVTIVSGTAEYNLNSTTVIAAGDFDNFDKRGLKFRTVQASTASTVTVETIISGRDGFIRRDIDWLNQNEPGWDLTPTSTGSQFPTYYYVRSEGSQLLVGLVPPPQFSTLYTVTLTVPYIAAAPTMSSATDEPFQFAGLVRTDLRSYHMGLVHYAAHQLEKLRQDDQRSDRQMQKFMGYVSQYVADQRIKGGRQIRQARNYFTSHTGQWGAWRVWTGR